MVRTIIFVFALLSGWMVAKAQNPPTVTWDSKSLLIDGLPCDG